MLSHTFLTMRNISAKFGRCYKNNTIALHSKYVKIQMYININLRKNLSVYFSIHLFLKNVSISLN